jgi:hypothetical protein
VTGDALVHTGLPPGDSPVKRKFLLWVAFTSVRLTAKTGRDLRPAWVRRAMVHAFVDGGVRHEAEGGTSVADPTRGRKVKFIMPESGN